MAADETFLEALSDVEDEALRAVGRKRRFARGATLFLEGEVSGNVVVVLGGRVKVSYLTEDGREVVLAIREAGDVLGELSAVDGLPHSATASALDPVDAVVIGADRFKIFLRDHPEAALTLLRLISRRLRDADRKRVEFGAGDTVGRIAGRLLELAERYGRAENGSVRVDLPFTQEELASWVGSSRKAVTNALQQMRARGWITTGRKSIVIRDVDALRERAV